MGRKVMMRGFEEEAEEAKKKEVSKGRRKVLKILGGSALVIGGGIATYVLNPFEIFGKKEGLGRKAYEKINNVTIPYAQDNYAIAYFPDESIKMLPFQVISNISRLEGKLVKVTGAWASKDDNYFITNKIEEIDKETGKTKKEPLFFTRTDPYKYPEGSLEKILTLEQLENAGYESVDGTFSEDYTSIKPIEGKAIKIKPMSDVLKLLAEAYKDKYGGITIYYNRNSKTVKGILPVK